MSEFLLLHDNDHDGKPAVIRKGIITSVIESDYYPEGCAIYSRGTDGEYTVLEATETIEEIFKMLNQ
jgi:hypothetical protein